MKKILDPILVLAIYAGAFAFLVNIGTILEFMVNHLFLTIAIWLPFAIYECIVKERERQEKKERRNQ